MKKASCNRWCLKAVASYIIKETHWREKKEQKRGREEERGRRGEAMIDDCGVRALLA